MHNKKLVFFHPNQEQKKRMHLAEEGISAGFPSPADDFKELRISIYGTNIEQGVIMMCTPDLFYQQFVLNGSRFRQYKWLWLARLSEYYSKKM